jgi:hypothetical protein
MRPFLRQIKALLDGIAVAEHVDDEFGPPVRLALVELVRGDAHVPLDEEELPHDRSQVPVRRHSEGIIPTLGLPEDGALPPPVIDDVLAALDRLVVRRDGESVLRVKLAQLVPPVLVPECDPVLVELAGILWMQVLGQTGFHLISSRTRATAPRHRTGTAGRHAETCRSRSPAG